MEYDNLLNALARHAKNQPQKKAVYLLNSNDVTLIDSQITYHDLFQASYALAGIIKTQTNPGDRAFLCFPTGTDFIIAFYASLIAKVIPVAVMIPSYLGLVKKFSAIYTDCSPKVILTDEETQHQYLQSPEIAALCDASQIIVTDHLDIGNSTTSSYDKLPEITSHDLAFLQYTSGSTANPKGVMISHGNLIDNLSKMGHAFQGNRESIGLNWLPLTHDMGLIGSFLHSIHYGATLYLMSPMSFIRRPVSWLKALSIYKAQITGCPCFGLKMCLDALTPESISELDLHQLRYIIVGSEPISSNLVHDFFQRLAPTGLSETAFAPAYGLAEATLMVSTRLSSVSKTLDYSALRSNQVTFVNPNHKPSTTIMSCGYPSQSVQIVSEKTATICSEDEIGEVWLHGESIALGYWENPNESQRYFEALLPNDSRSFFKTGDLGFLHQGELYIVGRIKEVIIINGFNYYPQDLEQTVFSCDEALHHANCVAFRWRTQNAATDSFVVLVKTAKRISETLQTTLTVTIKKQLLKEYHLVPHDIQFVTFHFPKTTSGKLQRNTCRELYITYYKQQSQRESYAEQG